MWRPGDPAPFDQSKKKKKKSKKAADAVKKDRSARNEAPTRVAPAKQKRAPAKTVAEVETKKEDSESFVATGDGRLETSYLQAERRRLEMPATKLSSTIRGLKFMVKKEEEKQREKDEREKRRKMNDEKWVIDPELLKTESGTVVCEQLQTAPRAFVARRSFGAFNPNVESFISERKRLDEDDEISREIEETAISAEEMANVMISRGGISNGSRKRPLLSGMSKKKKPKTK